MNDSTKRLRKKMRESEHDYSWQRKIVKGIRRVSFAIMILWSVGFKPKVTDLTGPVRDAYFALSDNRMIGQFENVNGFINKAQYPNQQGVLSSEWGTIGNIRLYLSSRGSITTNGSMLGADIFNVFIGGQESYAKIEQNGVSSKFIYHPPGRGEDPAELRQTAAYRFAQVPRITNDAWIISLRCTLA